VLSPSTLRIVLRSQQNIRTAVDGPVEGISEDGAFRGRAPQIRDQESRLARLALKRMGGDRQKKHRNAFDTKGAAIDHSIVAKFHDHMMSVKLPFRMRQFATRDRAVMHDIVIRTSFFH